MAKDSSVTEQGSFRGYTIGEGVKDGLPIGLGYLSVSFTFGILAVSKGLSWLQASIISLTNITSAGHQSPLFADGHRALAEGRQDHDASFKNPSGLRYYG